MKAIFWLTWGFQIGIALIHHALTQSQYLFALAAVGLCSLMLVGSLVAVSTATGNDQSDRWVYTKSIISPFFVTLFSVTALLTLLFFPQYTLLLSLVLSILTPSLFLLFNPAWLALGLKPEIRARADTGQWLLVFHVHAIASSREWLRSVLIDRSIAVIAEGGS